MQPADVVVVMIPGTPIVKAIRLNGVDLPNCIGAVWSASPDDEFLQTRITLLATSIKTVEPDAD